MKIASLFSGAGGFDLGMLKAGHQIVWANDILEDACKTYRININEEIICADIADIDYKNVPKCDVVIGGFPCQGFSIANMKRNVKDPRNLLYLEFLRSLDELKPKYFFAENVRGILSLDKGRVFKKILEDFSNRGYSIQYKLLNAANYGVPQNRYRVFIFGERKDLKKNILFDLEETHGKGKKDLVTIGEVLHEIPDPEEDHDLSNHVYSKFKFKNSGYINHRKINPDKPAPTVTARGDTKGGAMINLHPKGHRRLSVRECAIIQSFPMDFEFYGSMTNCYMQIGNAVPPTISYTLGSFLKEIEEGNSKQVQQVEMNF